MGSSIFFRRGKLFWTNLALLFPALISLVVAVHNGLRINRSQDFQWSGTHLFALHRDPYLVYLQKDPNHEILLSQVPNYLHELYILLLPLGSISEHAAATIWVGLNLLFATASIFLLGNIFKLSRGRTLLLGLLFATSTPFRVAVGNGQQSLLELLLLLVALANPLKAGWPLGLSYFKYSFSPILVFYLACRKAYRNLVLSTVLPVLGWLVFWLRVGGSPVKTAFEPALVGRMGVAPGTADLVTLLMFLAPRWVPFGLLLTVVLSGLTAYAINWRAKSLPQAGAALAVCCLFLFPHLIYDFVLLIVPVAMLLSRDRPTRRSITSSIVCLIGLAYLMPWIGGGHGAELIRIWINLSLLLILGASVISSPGTLSSEPCHSPIDRIRPKV